MFDTTFIVPTVYNKVRLAVNTRFAYAMATRIAVSDNQKGAARRAAAPPKHCYRR
jgi:hypothetical protein